MMWCSSRSVCLDGSSYSYGFINETEVLLVPASLTKCMHFAPEKRRTACESIAGRKEKRAELRLPRRCCLLILPKNIKNRSATAKQRRDRARPRRSLVHTSPVHGTLEHSFFLLAWPVHTKDRSRHCRRALDTQATTPMWIQKFCTASC
jgi:hypothetical protein